MPNRAHLRTIPFQSTHSLRSTTYPRDFIPHGRSESARAQGFARGKTLDGLPAGALLRLRRQAWVIQGHRVQRDNRRYSVLVDHLLPAVGVQHHGEAVEAGDAAPHLETVHQKHGHGQALLADFGQKDVLKVVFLHNECSFSLCADGCPPALILSHGL